jgi:integrase
VADIREIIVADHPNIYFTTHDLRATFATNWIYDQRMKTGMPFEALIDDLAQIMGHDDSSTTQKYINYANDDRVWKEFSQRKNDFANKVMIGNL